MKSSEWRNLAHQIQVRTDRHGVERYRIRYGGMIIPVESLSDANAMLWYYENHQTWVNQYAAALNRFFPGIGNKLKMLPNKAQCNLMNTLLELCKARLPKVVGSP